MLRKGVTPVPVAMKSEERGVEAAGEEALRADGAEGLALAHAVEVLRAGAALDVGDGQLEAGEPATGAEAME